jgi:hypothetical protein
VGEVRDGGGQERGLDLEQVSAIVAVVDDEGADPVDPALVQPGRARSAHLDLQAGGRTSHGVETRSQSRVESSVDENACAREEFVLTGAEPVPLIDMEVDEGEHGGDIGVEAAGGRVEVRCLRSSRSHGPAVRLHAA